MNSGRESKVGMRLFGRRIQGCIRSSGEKGKIRQGSQQHFTLLLGTIRSQALIDMSAKLEARTQGKWEVQARTAEQKAEILKIQWVTSKHGAH